jgi:hypothetical protein
MGNERNGGGPQARNICSPQAPKKMQAPQERHQDGLPQGLSQRDKIIQPRVDRAAGNPGLTSTDDSTLKGLDRGRWIGFNPFRVAGDGGGYLG